MLTIFDFLSIYGILVELSMKKYQIFALAITFITPFITRHPTQVFASQPTILSYAQDDLGASSVSLNDFNIEGKDVTVNKDTNKGIVMTTDFSQASSVFLKERLAADPTRPGFSTYFVMNVYKLNDTHTPADGYMFVIAANSNSLGASGGGLGYSGILNSIGIEFDFFNNNNSENVASSDVFKNGDSSNTRGDVFDNQYISQFKSVGIGQLVRAFHTWIEYDHLIGKLELRVALSNFESASSQIPSQRPARPTTPILTRHERYPQISEFFYAGFTAATGGQMQQMTLKSWYMSNAYLPNGINPDTDEILIDNTPPTAPTIQTTNLNGTYSLSINGGTDNQGIAGYQYKVPGGNWITFNQAVTMNTVGEYQARTVDFAGNFSTSVTSIWLYQINFSAGGTIIKTVYRVNTDDDLVVDERYFDGVNLYKDWYLSNTFSGEPLLSIAPRTTSITIYGKPIQQAFAVQYVLDGGTLATSNPAIYVIGESFELTNPTKIGHSFSAWYLDQDKTILFDEENIPEQAFTLFASYTVNDYVLTVYFQDDDASISTYSLNYNTHLLTFLVNLETQITESKLGHTFINWYFDDAMTDLLVLDTDRLTADISVYAKWEANTYTVEYYLPDDTLYTTSSVVYDTAITLPVDPAIVGFTFTGWTHHDDIIADGTLMPAANLTLYATFSRNEYGLIIQPNNGLLSGGITLPYETLIADYLPSDLTKIGHTFSGWYYDAYFTDAYTNEDVILGVTTLYAQWIINTYTISFDTQGGNPLESSTQTFDDALLLPTNPSRLGYTFIGWSLDAQHEQPLQLTTVPAMDLTLFAQWQINTYTIAFDSHGGTTVANLDRDYLSEVGTLPTPVKQGHTFAGWFMDEALTLPFVSTLMPADHVTLYAAWIVNAYQVTFTSAHEGSPYLTIEIHFGSIISPPNNPTRDGYRFIGWSLDGVLSQPQTMAMPDQPLTFVAMWEGLSSQVILITPNETTIITTTSGEAIGPLPVVAVKPGYVFLGWSTIMGDASALIDDTYVVAHGQTIRLYPIWEKTSEPLLLIAQYVQFGFQSIQDYTYETILFTLVILTGVAMAIIYRKREQYGHES
jgi:uncharacterized repeat protein (TIGR02543 family)